MGVVPILTITLGVAMGIVAGATPGLSPSMGVALLVPFTYAMSPTLALILLVAIYIAANYGGSITAVTINAPGTPSSVVTAFDGYPLTKKGKPGLALGVSLVASTVGGIIGTLILIFFSGPLARFALKFHPAEYFALAIFGLTTVASLGGKNWIKAFIAAMFGLLLNTIGIDPISGVSRFTFGISFLYDGFALIPALIGLFALSEIFKQLESGDFTSQQVEAGKQEWPTASAYWKLKNTIFRSSLMGTIIGIFPGAGATIAAFISYDVAKRVSKHPEEFGHGSLEGVAAAEGANSSSVGGALIPLLTLGIPGSASTAVLIGALMIHDLTPGPQLFISNPDIIYGLLASLLFANIILLALGFFGSRLWIKVTTIPKTVLFPLIFAVSIIGSFAVRNSFFDVAACLAFGIFGWILRRYNYPVAPIILGMVLGNIAETNFIRAIMMGGWTVFFTRPLSLGMLVVAVASFAVPLIQARKQKTSS
ncbi:MAG: tripartite tricarboxylate transporter permease [Candidatus Marinimicrobia bacterium]|nr:tripartite tricarboxylate transporter permease [FCB group bacterium]MBL7026656.1 tripartite tricarboxylate transporter permease [Candidatus Neomarinimicrobiota bacterium]